MRRIINNTTAIAACLSLLAPHLAMAEMRLTDAEAAARAEAQARDRSAEFAALQAEIEAGLDKSDLECADGSERPCDDDMPFVTPNGLTVALSESGTIVLADGLWQDGPQDGADLNAEADADETGAELEAALAEAEATEDAPAQADAPESEAEMSADEARAETEAALEAETEVPALPEDAPEFDADAADETPGGDAASVDADISSSEMTEAAAVPVEDLPAADDADETPAAEATSSEASATEAPATEAELNEAEPASESEEATSSDASDDEMVDELARALAGTEAGETQSEAEAGAEETVRVAGGPVQQERAGNLPGLARVFQEEVDGGLTLAALTCIGGGAAPCDGRSITPRGVVIEPNDAGAFRLAPASAQIYRVGEDGAMELRAAEEGAAETEAAREAAAGTEGSAAAALDAAEGTGERSEQQVTEESARRSTEDFQTNLRDALQGATGQAQQSSGRDNDLTRALLLGLGAVAVGTVLANNRQVALSAPDRVVVTRPDGSQEVIRDDVALLRQPGSTVTTENFDDGSSRTIVTRADGSRVVTIRDADLRVLRRTLIQPDGTTTQLIDETAPVAPVDVATLPAPAPVTQQQGLDESALRAALQREANVDRRFSLSQIRNIPEVRALVAPVNIEAITFDTGSAAIRPDQAQQLASLGRVIEEQIRANPREIFLIEGHTDTVGSEAYNLALSDRRAESVALALAEYFAVPPENLVTQGYGEQFLLIRQEGDIRENRRASVRRITDLLMQ